MHSETGRGKVQKQIENLVNDKKKYLLNLKSNEFNSKLISIFGKSFNEFQYKKHLNNKFKDGDLINIYDTTDKIKFSVKCRSIDRDFKIKSNFKQYIDFANTMAYCVGFHIHNTTTGYDVYFGKKTDNEDLILDTNGNYECYTAILTTNPFINDINTLYAYKNKLKIYYYMSLVY